MLNQTTTVIVELGSWGAHYDFIVFYLPLAFKFNGLVYFEAKGFYGVEYVISCRLTIHSKLNMTMELQVLIKIPNFLMQVIEIDLCIAMVHCFLK